MSARYGFLDDVIDLDRKEPLLRHALFNSVSAHQLYRDIVRETLQPGLALRLAGTVGASLLGLTSKAGSGLKHHEAKP